MNRDIDEIDRSILIALQHDGAISNAELARRISLSPPAVHARIKRLEELGYIKQYVAVLNREKLGYDMLCLVGVTLQLHQPEQIDRFHEEVRRMPEVLECHFLTGDFDYLLKVVVRNRKELERLLMERLTRIPGVSRVSTSLVLGEIKNSLSLPLDQQTVE
ncbi:MAG: Lrp/AsnC family transcriptional regulator [bacterium]|nr:Lrp/AsnC family transcriptional regulator [bacterium]